MEELWSKGEAGGDFDSSSRLLEPDHFQCMFLIMGCIFSLWLIVALWDILTNKKIGFLKIMLYGLFACLLITFVNLYLFSTSLWTPITYDKMTEREYFDSRLKSSFDSLLISDSDSRLEQKVNETQSRTFSKEEYEYNMEVLVKNKTVALAILGYGAVTSFLFIFIAMIRSLGNTHIS